MSDLATVGVAGLLLWSYFRAIPSDGGLMRFRWIAAYRDRAAVRAGSAGLTLPYPTRLRLYAVAAPAGATVTLNRQGRVMTEAAAETGSAHPVRDRDRVPRARTAVRLTRHDDLASARAARPMRAARRWGSRLPPMVGDSLLPALLLLNIMTTRAPQELPVAVALTAALALPLVWRRRAPLTVFGVVAAAAFVQWLMDVQLPSDIALLVALYTAAANSGRRGTLVTGAIVEGGALLACLRWATEGSFLTPSSR